jgi:hypothetical protein
VLTCGAPDRGTALTVKLAERSAKPCLVLDLGEAPAPQAVRAWAEKHRISVLNVAGPRETSKPGIYAAAKDFLRSVLSEENDC